jgi:hypothetical protein
MIKKDTKKKDWLDKLQNGEWVVEKSTGKKYQVDGQEGDNAGTHNLHLLDYPYAGFQPASKFKTYSEKDTKSQVGMKCKHEEDVSWGSLALAMSGKGQYKQCIKCKRMFDIKTGKTVTWKQIWN